MFAKGAPLAAPAAGLLNSRLEWNVRRAIDLRDGEKVDAKAFDGAGEGGNYVKFGKEDQGHEDKVATRNP